VSTEKRLGDTIKIAGDYQHKAITEGFTIQRFWHHAKILSILKFLPPSPGDHVLDVGCGSGVVTAFLGSLRARAVGIDINQEAIGFAEEFYASEDVSFRLGAVDRLDENDGSVDKVYCIEVIEHIYKSQAETMLREFHRVLRPGGKLFLTTPNYRSMWPLIEWAMDHSGLFPTLSGHQHVEHYTTGALGKLCIEQKFEVVLMATTCLFSPWISLVNWKAAEALFALELKVPVHLGSIVTAVLERK
jgi:2-polyprenyl-3-methyl-5-hydroxy-6-metoxy-1,4-benzoquinol methylase